IDNSTFIQDDINANIEPVIRPDLICGSVTNQKVVNGLAPKSIEASSNTICSSVITASKERSTKGIIIIVCPTSSASKLRTKPKLAPNCSNAAPSTMCGRTKGDIKVEAKTDFPLKSRLDINNASGTAINTDTTVATKASNELVMNASI